MDRCFISPYVRIVIGIVGTEVEINGVIPPRIDYLYHLLATTILVPTTTENDTLRNESKYHNVLKTKMHIICRKNVRYMDWDVETIVQFEEFSLVLYGILGIAVLTDLHTINQVKIPLKIVSPNHNPFKKIITLGITIIDEITGKNTISF